MSLRFMTGLFLAVALPLGAAEAATFTTLHHFSGADGALPTGAIGFDAAGALYGTTLTGGSASSGTVYRLLPPKAGETQWTRETLHNFIGGVDGVLPKGGVTVGAQGRVYGTTPYNGSFGGGTTFVLNPPATGSTVWNYRIIWSFKPGSTDYQPLATVRSVNGKLYGTTHGETPKYERGAVYELTPSKTSPTGWSEKAIATNVGFSDTNVVIDAAGRIYFAGLGMQRLTPPATDGGAWTKEILFNPPGEKATPPILGANGRIWGAVGTTLDYEGAIYFADPPTTVGGAWKVTTIKTFYGGYGGAEPNNLIRVGNMFYGTTRLDGSEYRGIIFSLTPPDHAGGAWKTTILHTFRGPDGYEPRGLIYHSGKLYGTTYRGGTFRYGTVYSFTP